MLLTGAIFIASETATVAWAGALGLAVGLMAQWLISRRIVTHARENASGTVGRAREEADRVLGKARKEVAVSREEWSGEFSRERAEIEDGLEELASVMQDRERDFDRRSEEVGERSNAIDELKRSMRHLKTQRRRKERELRRTGTEQKEALLERAGMTEEEARERILGVVSEEVRREQETRFARRLELLEDDLEKRARRVISIAIGRCNISHEANTITGSLTLPSKAFKSRLVGPEGKNQAVFEELTGVNLIFDEDEPLNLVLSAYDGMRKAIARRTIEKLISQNSAIQPARIKEFVEKSTREMKRIILDGGRKVCSSMRVKGVDPEIQSLIGRLNFRTSYGQNVLKHSKEVAFVASTIAAETGLDARLAKRCGLLHDIGKAVDAEIEGGHPEIGAEIATRCEEKQPVIEAIGLHHEDADTVGTFVLLTMSGDAVSGSRPGARRETLERYLKHLEDLETIGQSANGVEQAYAIQAGRELRVFVDPKKVNDETAHDIARDITTKVEEELTYPGKIKVSVIRESKTTAFAR